MTNAEIRSILDETGIYYDPDHPDFVESAKKEDLTSFLEWETEETAMYADGIKYYSWLRLTIRLYTDPSDTETEKALKNVLDSHDLIYDSSKKIIADLMIYETTYTLEV